MSNITKVHLLKVMFEKNYEHTLYFETKERQHEYFINRSIPSRTYSELYYQRKDGIIMIPKHVDDLLSEGVNYCMYQNEKYPDKWFYAFITDMKYVNDGNTEVHIKTDCIQTWMFDINIKESFVEREHADSDEIGEHTLDEGLETGEYVVNDFRADTNLQDCKYIIMTTEMPADADKWYAINMGGIPYAGGAIICEHLSEMVSIVNALSAEGYADAVYAVYMVPSIIIADSGPDTMVYDGTTIPVMYNQEVSKLSALNGYYPRNKKLLCYPYTYLLHSNNAGSSNVLKFEDFSTENCRFEVKGVPVVGGSIKSCPRNYKGVQVNQEEGIVCGKFPTLSWSADLFTNWLTQNSVNIAMGIASGAAQVVGGVATMALTGGAGGAIGGATALSGVTSIANTLAQVHQQSFTPNSARGNTNAGDINTAAKSNTFYYYSMSIKKEYAKVIDEYFDMFGYKCNRLKVPAKNHRERYWYTKTIGANIWGNIPQEDLQEIKDCYNRGITFWRNDDLAIRDYDAFPNGIVKEGT